VRIEVDEQEALPDLGLQAGETHLGLVEVIRLIHARRNKEIALQ